MELSFLKFLQDHRSSGLTVLFGGFSLLGETVFFFALVLVLVFLLPREKRGQMIFAVLFSLALNLLFKYTVLRPRPYISGEIIKLDPPLSKGLNPNTSFPSGHVQLVASLCGALMTGKDFTLLLPVIPAVVALARLYFGVHYPSDVLFGYFFGFAAVLVARALPPRPQNA